ncbi:ABC transporter ATP-binding protein [Rhodopirellula sp. MGV]|uniref:ABC transporter ATP-binding protein n=1 Tax=Rhodopirellula sp. MGV TaxID=2023130 RepID=UPI000B96DF2E|nr:ABC transporter ATP-binding protein [Rhodopirellula sp. MGV]OYP32960.1 cobalamin/Fe(3+)-siderophore ABC transporter ATP-binding protein [Rhodopirellula sp. MGV]PNY35383.1 ABC transporter ATP-binding protein [Rhodopirellula baltica]
MAELTAENLSLRYDGDNIIHDVTLSISPNRITALVGPNGSGKSTLLRGLARLLPPSSGRVTIDGQNIHQLNTRTVAKRVSILAQSNDAPDGLTVRELVGFGRFPYRGWLGQADPDDHAAIERAMEIVGIKDLAQRPLGELSGGQRQLAWIAMSVAQDSEIMLLDEPTTFLDLSHQLEVLHLLETLQCDHGRTIVMVLHDINQAARFAHHIVALRDGRIRFQGSPATILTPEMLEDVFSVVANVMSYTEQPTDRSDVLTSVPYCVPLHPVGVIEA